MGRVKAKRVSVNSEQEMVEGLARAVQPTPPVKRMGKSRAASSVLINTTRCCVLTLIHLSKLTCCQLPIPSGLNWELMVQEERARMEAVAQHTAYVRGRRRRLI